MKHDLMDSWPRLLRAAVESAGYRVARWLAARGVLQARFAKGRIPQELTRFLDRWLAASPLHDRSADRLLLHVQVPDAGALRIVGGDDGLSGVPLERALLHLPALRAFWRQELRQEHFQALLASVPQAWMQDDAPLPHGAVIHGLGITSWQQPLPAASTPWITEEGITYRAEAPAPRYTASYERDDKGRVQLRSIEASS